jgi:uncharacterized protein YcbX
MRVGQIVRYPVKSLQGEVLSAAAVTAEGLHGDRGWGIRDETTGRVLTARRAPGLLYASATLAADGTPSLTLPNGENCHGPGAETDNALSRWLGTPVSLVSSAHVPPGRAEFFADATDDSSQALEWTMPPGRFVDASPLLVLTTASLRAAALLYPEGDWQVRRFRPNLVVDVGGDAWVEDDWYGQSVLRIGTTVLRPEEPCVRCTMVTRPQPGIVEDRDIFRTIARHRRGLFGAWTVVSTPGAIHVGDPVEAG